MTRIQTVLLAGVFVALSVIAFELAHLDIQLYPFLHPASVPRPVAATETREQRLERESRRIQELVDDNTEIYARVSASKKAHGKGSSTAAPPRQ